MDIYFESWHLINEPRSVTYLYLNLTLLAVTMTLNIWAVKVISAKEKTGINYMLITDCFASIVYMVLGTLRQFPWFSFESSTLCTVYIFFLVFLTIFNRMVPVAVATIRYIMICHPTFSINQGGEKRISAIVRNTIIFSTATSSIYSTFKRKNILQFLICVQKEETFR